MCQLKVDEQVCKKCSKMVWRSEERWSRCKQIYERLGRAPEFHEGKECPKYKFKTRKTKTELCFDCDNAHLLAEIQDEVEKHKAKKKEKKRTKKDNKVSKE